MTPRVHLCPRTALLQSMRLSLDQAKYIPERAAFYRDCAKRAFWALVEMSK